MTPPRRRLIYAGHGAFGRDFMNCPIYIANAWRGSTRYGIYTIKNWILVISNKVAHQYCIQLVMFMTSAKDREMNRHKTDPASHNNASSYIYNKIVNLARAKQFDSAEALRESLYTLDPIPLEEIIKSADIIEYAKIKSINQHLLELWADFVETIAIDELYLIFNSMQETTYRPGDNVYSKGDKVDTLYFIHSGRLKIVHSADDKNINIKIISSGYIAGTDGFFRPMLSDSSLVAITDVTLGALSRKSIHQNMNRFPMLENKIFTYISQFDTVSKIVCDKCIERRVDTRIRIFDHGSLRIIGPSGQYISKEIYISLFDISLGGLAFFMLIPKKETARLLLGRKINVRICSDNGSGTDCSEKINLDGIVVSVDYNNLHESLVHVKLLKRLSQKQLQKVFAS